MCECTCRPPSSTPAHPRTNPTSRSPSIAPHETLPLAARARTTSRSRCWPPHVRSITSLIRSASSTVTSGSSVTPAALAVSRASVQGRSRWSSLATSRPAPKARASYVEPVAAGCDQPPAGGGSSCHSTSSRSAPCFRFQNITTAPIAAKIAVILNSLRKNPPLLLCGLVAHRGPPSGYQRTCVRLRVRRDGQPSIDAVGRYPDGRAAGVPRVSGPGWT